MRASQWIKVSYGWFAFMSRASVDVLIVSVSIYLTICLCRSVSCVRKPAIATSMRVVTSSFCGLHTCVGLCMSVSRS
jgi:hypothetical protein